MAMIFHERYNRMGRSQFTQVKQPFAQIFVTIIKKGDINRQEIGIDYEHIAFLVIQHSDLETMERYLPVIEREVKNHTQQPSAYAYLFDRKQWLKTSRNGMVPNGQKIRRRPRPNCID